MCSLLSSFGALHTLFQGCRIQHVVKAEHSCITALCMLIRWTCTWSKAFLIASGCSVLPEMVGTPISYLRRLNICQVYEEFLVRRKLCPLV